MSTDLTLDWNLLNIRFWLTPEVVRLKMKVGLI